MVYNGEVYNYLELRDALDYPYRSRTDTEVILAAYEKWGADCLHRLVGMFSFVIWDEHEQTLFGARDRFGVKPLYYSSLGPSALAIASEIKALHAAGVPAVEDEETWATYLTRGQHDHFERTFWRGVQSLPPGHAFRWQSGDLKVWRWYDLAEAVGEAFDERPIESTSAEYLDLLRESVRLRFRADVPVGINLSGGLDSSILLSLVRDLQGPDSQVKAFTFVTGDPRYDETPWVEQMLDRTRHPLTVCELSAGDVPALAEAVQRFEDEPFGGVPTLAYGRLFERARQGGRHRSARRPRHGRAVGRLRLLPGSDLAGRADAVAGGGRRAGSAGVPDPGVHGLGLTVRACGAVWRRPAEPSIQRRLPDQDPWALRFNDRVSMRASTELREPFLDHRLFELAVRQPADRKIVGDTGKWLLRNMVATHLPGRVVEAPKRPLQTPQREWLRGPLRGWATELIEEAVSGPAGSWFRPQAVKTEWTRFCEGQSDNSFYVWQWISLALMRRVRVAATQAWPSAPVLVRTAYESPDI